MALRIAEELELPVDKTAWLSSQKLRQVRALLRSRTGEDWSQVVCPDRLGNGQRANGAFVANILTRAGARGEYSAVEAALAVFLEG